MFGSWSVHNPKYTEKQTNRRVFGGTRSDRLKKDEHTPWLPLKNQSQQFQFLAQLKHRYRRFILWKLHPSNQPYAWWLSELCLYQIRSRCGCDCHEGYRSRIINICRLWLDLQITVEGDIWQGHKKTGFICQMEAVQKSIRADNYRTIILRTVIRDFS